MVHFHAYSEIMLMEPALRSSVVASAAPGPAGRPIACTFEKHRRTILNLSGITAATPSADNAANEQ